MAEHDPFADWTDLFNKPVYSIDGKKLGFLRKITSDYMIVKKGLINMKKYAIPKSAAESVGKKGIRLRITAYVAATRYSGFRIKNTLASTRAIPESEFKDRQIVDRLQTIRYGTTRNRIAAAIAFVSGVMFLISGYKANIAIYNLIRDELVINTAKDFWAYAVIPVGFLAILSQLGGFTVMMGAGLFAANRVNIGKFLVMVGTGQGLFTIMLRVLSELWSGRLALENNYVTWLTTTAAGLGILFAIISQSVSKGKGQSIGVRALRYILGKRKGKRKG